jgi:hypothetical protein
MMGLGRRLVLGIALLGAVMAYAQQGMVEVLKKHEIAKVWAGHPVGFAILTQGGRQIIAYYDAERRMCLASRELHSDSWHYEVLPSSTGWDSHNYLTMTIDDEQHIHLAGNMHCVPLIYFRSTRPMDISSLEQLPSMVGSEEKRCTYPRFMRGANRELIFAYRDGQSGNGNDIYNVYDHKTRQWQRLLDQALTDGEGQMNAYCVGPKAGPDGFFHLCWVWRDNYNCDTNHNLSYARSRDLRQWETVAGEPVSLPMTLASPGLIVDPTPRARSGMINMGINIGFDAQQRVILSYHKYDEKGHSQIYNARREGERWNIVQTSDWDWRWEFTGGGCVPCEVSGGAVRPDVDGFLAQSYRNREKGSGTWKLDANSLKPVGKIHVKRDKMPADWDKIEGTFPGLQRKSTRSVADDGSGIIYLLRWETLPVNRDRPRPEPWPEASTLTLWEVRGNI